MNDTTAGSIHNSEQLQYLKQEFTHELQSILSYWLNNMQDDVHGGFYGQRLWDETLVNDAPKSAVLNARILWTFSAAARLTKSSEYKLAAKRVFDFFIQYFVDQHYGGVYWSVQYDGAQPGTKKQVYAQSFAIYALAEYYLLTADETARQLAIEIFQLIEEHSRDREEGGYIEAFTQTWEAIDDLRLSEKDANEKKTMNTHLHILEGYTNLYRMHPAPEIKEAITHLLEMFDQHIIDCNHHLILFFDEHWNRKGTQISYGHDIEAAWLLCEAAEVTGDEYWINNMNAASLKIVEAAMEGLDTDHGLWHEYDPSTDYWVKEKHWWPQAEAMVGFLHAWQLTANQACLQRLQNSWQFIRRTLLDKQHGEWIWGIKADGIPITSEDKAGFWKCPYHNGRACMEIIRRLS
jgi:mannobiose 2-epimerase